MCGGGRGEACLSSDRGGTTMAETKARSNFLKNEDWMAVWLGFLIIVLVLLGVQVKMPAFKWTTDGEVMSLVAETRPAMDGLVKSAGEKGEAALLAAATALQTAMGGQDRKAIGDAGKKLGDAAKKAQDPGLKKKAGDIGKGIVGPAGQTADKVFSAENIKWSVLIGLGFLILAAIGNALMGRGVGMFILKAGLVKIGAQFDF